MKLSPFYTSISSVARGLEEAGADALVLFNRLFEPEIDVEALEVKRVLHLSDSSELPLRLRWLAILSAQRKIPLAISGGVHETVDIIRALMAGATAVQLVSTLLRNGPSRLLSLRASLERWLVEREYTSVRQLRGSMNLKACPDPSAYERANYIHLLHGWREHPGTFSATPGQPASCPERLPQLSCLRWLPDPTSASRLDAVDRRGNRRRRVRDLATWCTRGCGHGGRMSPRGRAPRGAHRHLLQVLPGCPSRPLPGARSRPAAVWPSSLAARPLLDCAADPAERVGG